MMLALCRILPILALGISLAGCGSPAAEPQAATSHTAPPAADMATSDAAPADAATAEVDAVDAPASPMSTDPLVIGAIPDQDPEKLQRQFETLGAYLGEQIGVPVEYRPVTDYAAAVTAFKVGDLDMVWFGGLTGVQARLQVRGARAILQRDIDAEFHSVFIANTASGIAPFDDIAGLKSLAGHTFTFGSDSSTSGRLMPQHFLQQAGVGLGDFTGEAGFSGSHDKTIALVAAGTYEAGVLNEQVWKTRTAAGEVDLTKVQLIWTTPAYFDYHWIVGPSVEAERGPEFVGKIEAAFLALDASDPAHKAILDLFGAQKFIPTEDANYADIEAIGREIGKIK